MNQLATQLPPTEIETFNPNAAIFDNDRFVQISRFAEMMSTGKCTVPAHLRNNPGDCLAVTMQAAQWGMNPFAVAQKTSLINGVLAYEAQLVNAVVSSSTAIKGRFKYEYGGEWEKLAGFKPKRAKNQNDKWVTDKGWPDDLENGLFIRVGAILNGESEIQWGEPVYLKNVDIRNSPLWATHPKQQIAYLAVKMWCRMYTPDVILGVYTPDEIEVLPAEPKDITPVSTADSLNAKLDARREQAALPHLTMSEFTQELAKATTKPELDAIAAKAEQLPDVDKESARRQFKARVAELKKQKPTKTEGPTKSDLLQMIADAKTADDLDVIADLANTLNGTDKDDVMIELSQKAGSL